MTDALGPVPRDDAPAAAPGTPAHGTASAYGSAPYGTAPAYGTASYGTETPLAKIERNWSELLQEFRVVQTGTQILTGFLLTLPFQAKFSSLSPFQTTLYLCLVVGSALATALALAPVSIHRALFRHGAKVEIVKIGNRLAIAALVVVSLVLTGTIAFIFDVVLGDTAALVAGIAALVGLFGLWAGVPISIRSHLRPPVS